MSADTDMLTNGVGLFAYDMAGNNATVNGINFIGLATPGLTATTNIGVIATPSSGAVSYKASVFATNNGTASPFYTTLSPAYQSLLYGGNYGSAGNVGFTLTLSNLTVGHLYAVQLWVVDTRNNAGYEVRAQTVTSPGGNTITLAFNANQAPNGLGQYGIGVFTADSTKQTFTLTPTSSVGIAQVNAIQFRDVTGAGYNPYPTWNGGSAVDSNWSDATNWNGVSFVNNASIPGVIFDGSARQTNTNNLTGLSLGAIAFNTTGWNITGSPITLGGNINAAATGVTTFGLDTLLNTTPTISQTSTGGVLNLTGVYSGGNGITISGSSGVINLSNPNNNFTGPVTVSSGTLGYSSLADPGQNSSLGAGGTINLGSAGNAAALSFIGTNSVSTARVLSLANNSSGSVTFNNNSPNNSSQTFNSDVSLYNATANDVASFNFGGTSSGTNTFNGQWENTNTTIGRFPGNLNLSGPGTWAFNGLMWLTNSVNIGTNSHFVLGNGSGNSSLLASVITVKPGGIFDVSAYSQSTPFILGAYALSATPAPQTMTAGRTDGTSATDILGSFAVGPTTLSIAGNGVPGTLTINGNFIPATSMGASTINFDLASTTTTGAAVNDFIQVNGNLDLSQGTTTVPVNLLQGTFQPNTPYTLIAYTGSLSGDASGLTVIRPSRAYAAVVSTATPGKVTLTYTSGGAPVANHLLWSGANSADWDANVTANWLNNGNSDYFYPQDSPFFDDTASQFGVNLVGNLLAGTVTVTNNVNDYTFSGGQMVGSTTLVKQGTARLNLNSANTYTGGTTINQGKVTIGASGAAGAGTITIATNASLSFSTTATLTNAIAGSGTITFPSTAEGSLNNGSMTNFIGILNIPASTTAQGDLIGANLNLNSAAVVNVGKGATLWASGITLNSTLNISGLGNNLGLGALRAGGSTIAGPVNLLGDTSIGLVSPSAGTVTGSISDAGHGYMLVKTGTGALTLAGANAYVGPTYVAAGTVNVTGNESASPGSWLMTNNTTAGAINFQPGSIIKVAATNIIQLGGWVNLVGSATETLNSYTAVTNNSSLLIARAGVLNISSNVWVQNGGMTNGAPAGSGYSANVSINPGGTFIYNGATPIYLNPSSGSSGNGQLTINGGVFKTVQGFTNSVLTSTGFAYLNITNNGTFVFLTNMSGLMTTAGATNSFQIGTANLDNGGFNITLPEAITNTPGQVGTLTFTNTGTFTLAGTNTYTGSTTISGGRLVVNGSLASSATTVNAGTTLGGSGTISGIVTLKGTITPGGSTNVATLTTGAETWNSGGAYEFSVNNVANGAGQDLLSINGLLTLPTNSASFTVKLTSLVGSTPGALVGFTSAGSYTWTIATASGGITNFTPGAITVDTTGFANSLTSQFGVTTNGNSLVLVYPFAAPVLTPPTLSGTASYSGGGFNFGFSGPNGQTYKVLASTNLTLPLASWTVVTSGTFGANPVNYTDTGATNGQKFYRVTSP